MTRDPWPTGGWLCAFAGATGWLLFAAGLAAYHHAWTVCAGLAVAAAVVGRALYTRKPHYHQPVRHYRCPACGWRGYSRLHYCREHP